MSEEPNGESKERGPVAAGRHDVGEVEDAAEKENRPADGYPRQHVLSKTTAQTEVPFAESSTPAESGPWILERWPLWICLAIVFVLLAYGPPLLGLLSETTSLSPGFKVW